MIGLLTKPRTNIKNTQKHRHNQSTSNIECKHFSSGNLILIIRDKRDKDSIIRPLIVISLSPISLVSFHFSLLGSCNNQKPRFRQFRQVNFLFLRIKFCEYLSGRAALSSHILQSGFHLSSTALEVTSDEITDESNTVTLTATELFPACPPHREMILETSDQIYRTGLISYSSSDSHHISPSDTMTHLIT